MAAGECCCRQRLTFVPSFFSLSSVTSTRALLHQNRSERTLNLVVSKNFFAFICFHTSAAGDFTVLKDDQTIGSMGEGQVFGELAILYNCTRTASVRADSDAAVWALDRRVFQAIMKKTGQDRRNENLAFLKRFVR